MSNEGNIYWLGIEDNDTLFKINNKLHQSLIDKGFELEDSFFGFQKYPKHW